MQKLFHFDNAIYVAIQFWTKLCKQIYEIYENFSMEGVAADFWQYSGMAVKIFIFGGSP